MVSQRTQDILTDAKKYLIDVHAPIGEEPWLVFESGHGVWLKDTEGREGIDTGSGGGVAHLGHGRKEIIDAIVEQLNKLERVNNWSGEVGPIQTECAKKLAQITPEGLDHVHFLTGGGEANDMAIKISYLYWHLQNKKREKIISLFGGYHGLGTATWVSSRPTFASETWGPPAPGFIHIPSYHCYRCMFGMKYPECNIRCARYLGQVIEYERPETVAAFIAEPVLGGYGHIPPPPEYWPIVRQICNDYDILLIADEVQSGFGRTGKMFALENWGVKPDIMTMAKSMAGGYVPFGGVSISEKIFQVLKGHQLTQSYTFNGHSVGCAAALAAMNIYTGEKVPENAAKVGKHIFERFDAEFRSLPCVDNITHLGLSLGMDIVADRKTKAPLPKTLRENLVHQAWENGILVRQIGGYGGTRERIYPPCIMTIEEADIMVDRLLELISSIKT